MEAILTVIAFKAFIGAFFWALVGVLSKESDEAFEPGKLFSTLLAGVIVAFLEVTWSIDPGTGQTVVTYLFFKTGLTGVIDKLLKLIWRRSGLKAWWDKVSTGG